MIAPLNFKEGSIVKAETTSLSEAKPTGDAAKQDAEILSTLPMPGSESSDEGLTEGPLTYFRYYLENADELAYRSEHSPRSMQQKLVRTGLIGAGVLATLASGMAVMESLTTARPETKAKPPAPPPTAQNPDMQELTGTKTTPKPAQPETIGIKPGSPLQFSLTPSPTIAQLNQSTGQLGPSTAPPPALPELSAFQVEATQAAFSLPEPQLATAPETAMLAPEAEQQLALGQSNQPTSLNPGTTSSFLNAAPSGLPQAAESSSTNLAASPIASNIAPPETMTTPLTAADAGSAIAVQPLAANAPNPEQEFGPDSTQPTVSTTSSNFPMPTVQTVASPASGRAELALQPNTATVTTPGDRLLEAVPAQSQPSLVSSLPPNSETIAATSVELPEDVSPGVRNLLQPNSEVTGIQVAVMPLTQQESQEVAMRDRLGQFKVLRLSQPDYQQEWHTSNGDGNDPAPNFGFVDYPRRVIAVMQPLTYTSATPISQPEQITSVSVSAPEPAIAPE
jgi:hypothetical protein